MTKRSEPPGASSLFPFPISNRAVIVAPAPPEAVQLPATASPPSAPRIVTWMKSGAFEGMVKSLRHVGARVGHALDRPVEVEGLCGDLGRESAESQGREGQGSEVQGQVLHGSSSRKSRFLGSGGAPIGPSESVTGMARLGLQGKPREAGPGVVGAGAARDRPGVRRPYGVPVSKEPSAPATWAGPGSPRDRVAPERPALDDSTRLNPRRRCGHRQRVRDPRLGDWDGDGLDDAIARDGGGRDRLLRNHGDGAFEDLSETALACQDYTSADALWIDADGGGAPARGACGGGYELQKVRCASASTRSSST